MEIEVLKTQPDALPTIRPLTESQMAEADTQTLTRHLSQTLTLTAQSLLYASVVWRELEKRGIDLSDLKSGLATYLPLIADGHLDAELVVRYAGQRLLLMAMARLPMNEQRELAQRGTVPLVVAEGDDLSVINVPLQELRSKDIHVAFGESFLRAIPDQSRLRTNQGKRKPRTKRRTIASIATDRENKTLSLGLETAPIASVVRALSNYYGFDVEELIQRRQTSEKAFDAVR